MRRAGWAAIGVLSNALAWAGAERRDDSASTAAADAPPTVPCVNRDACIQIVHAYQYGRRAGRDDARAAVDRVRELCADGEGIACWDVARWTALGADDLVTPDLEEARGFARRSCDLGSDCDVLKALSYPPPTAAELDDIREAVFRKGIPRERPRNALTQSPIYCLAFGTDADPTGQDPPQAFMSRFGDLEDVKPRSWCVEHRTGNRYSLGPLDASLRSFPVPMVRTVRMWSLMQHFSGSGAKLMVRVSEKDGTWPVAEQDFIPSNEAPAFPKADLDEDRRRIAATLSMFAEAWNRQDFEAMAGLSAGETEYLRSVAANWGRDIRGPGTDTRIEPSAVAVEFGELGSMSATARLRLRGTWTPSPGAIVPLDPWKHEGAVTTVRLHLRKQTSWWEPGDWTVRSLDLPWVRRY